MKNKYTLLILFTAFCCLGVQCKEDEKTEPQKLPSITAVGAQTFGCLINGEAFVTGERDILSAMYRNGVLIVQAQKHSITGIGPSVSFRIDNIITGKGKYKVSYNDPKQVFSVIISNNTIFYGDKLDSGFAEINILRFDTLNYYIAGTFDFITKDLYDRPLFVKVNSGRFDIKYQ